MIKNQLTDIIEKYKSLKLAKNHLKKINLRIQELHKRLVKLDGIVEQEYKDIEKLEKISIEKIFKKILGSKKKQIEQERQEYLSAVLQYNECKKSLELLDFERKILKEKIKEFNTTKSLLSNLIRKREKSLSKEKPKIKELINEINLKIDKKVEYKRELYEAINIGNKLIPLIKEILNDLKQVTNWGFYKFNNPDSHLKKTAYLNRARKKSYYINQLLQQFKDELEDIYKNENDFIKANIKLFQNFMSTFFENLITDWLLLQKIHDTSNGIQNLKNRVIRIMQSLENELVVNNERIKNLNKEKRKIIIKYN